MPLFPRQNSSGEPWRSPGTSPSPTGRPSWAPWPRGRRKWKASWKRKTAAPPSTAWRPWAWRWSSRERGISGSGGGGSGSGSRRILDAGNSGTTARLLLGLLAGQPFPATVTGDPSLRARPMLRVVEPLRRMGARVEGEGRRLPITIRGGDLHGVEHRLPVASAQIKSALLLAGLYARGVTVVEEPQPSRNHTELMLKQMGAPVEMDGCRVAIAGGCPEGGRIRIPGDISAAAFFMVAAALLPGAEVYLPGIGVNPTRSGVIDVLQEMGAEIAILNRRR